jgi:hypothetical protein
MTNPVVPPLAARIAREGPTAATVAAGAHEYRGRPLTTAELIRRAGWWRRGHTYADARAGIELLVADGWLVLTDEGVLPGPRHQAGRRRSTTR